MRRSGVRGCFELSNVVVEARTASETAPRIFATDKNAGPFTAILAKCSSDSEPVCDDETRAEVGQLLRGAVVTLRGYYWKDPETGFEELALQELDDPGILAEPPAPRPARADDLARSARAADTWFHYVTVGIPDDDPWGVADMSPAELLNDNCPLVAGFAVAPLSSSAAHALGCEGQTNPPSRPQTGSEVLIGRAFFHDFTWSSDCACAEAHKQHLLPQDATLVGDLRGILTFSMPLGGASGWQIVEPLSNADFPLVSP